MPVDATHPWLDARCHELQRKASAGHEGAAQELQTRIQDMYKEYAEKHRARMQGETNMSANEWWHHAKIATNQPVHHSSVPTLRQTNANWAAYPSDKAQLLADAAQKKNKGIPPWMAKNPMEDAEPVPEWNVKSRTKHKSTTRIIKDLKVDTAMAEGRIPAIVIQKCSRSLTP